MERADTGPVLVVDDEPTVREVLATYLRRDGFEVAEVADGAAAADWLAAHQPALMVLDVMLPAVDGLDLLRHIRRTGEVPVILLTARADEVDRVLGLELGADDYVVKPFSPREVVARVRSVLRRTNPEPQEVAAADAVLAFAGGLTIDRRAREVHLDGVPVALTPKEYDLLEHLASFPRQVFSRRQLLAHVWDSSPDFSRTLPP